MAPKSLLAVASLLVIAPLSSFTHGQTIFGFGPHSVSLTTLNPPSPNAQGLGTRWRAGVQLNWNFAPPTQVTHYRTIQTVTQPIRLPVVTPAPVNPLMLAGIPRSPRNELSTALPEWYVANRVLSQSVSPTTGHPSLPVVQTVVTRDVVQVAPPRFSYGVTLIRF